MKNPPRVGPRFDINRASVILTLVFLGCVVLPADLWVARNFTLRNLPGDIRGFINRAEVFGHGFGVFAILFTIWLLHRPRLRLLIAVSACAFGAGLTANVLKLTVGRLRPSAAIDIADLQTSFLGFAPWLSSGEWMAFLESKNHSFPSAHTATAFGLAVGLGYMFPRGRAWFLTLAAMVAIQRVAIRAHFVSDVFWGSSVGLAVATFILSRYVSVASDVEACSDTESPSLNLGEASRPAYRKAA